MKIKSWKLEMVWEDGTSNDVSCYIPEGLAREIEMFADYWEERYSVEDEENEDA